MCSVARDTSREPLLSPPLDASDEDVISPAQDSIVSCTTRSGGYTSYTSYTDYTHYTSSDRTTSAPSYTDTEYDQASVSCIDSARASASYADSVRESASYVDSVRGSTSYIESTRDSSSHRESIRDSVSYRESVRDSASYRESVRDSGSYRGSTRESASYRESGSHGDSIALGESATRMDSASQRNSAKRGSLDRKSSVDRRNSAEKRGSADGRGAFHPNSNEHMSVKMPSNAQTPLDPNWSISSGSSFSDYTDSSVTLPSLHEPAEAEEPLSENVLLPSELLSQASSFHDNGLLPSNPPSSGGFIGRLKGYAFTFVDKVMSDDRSNADLEDKSLTSNADSSFKNVSSMFSRNNSDGSSATKCKGMDMGGLVSVKQSDADTLLGMVKQYEEEKKTDPLMTEQDIPHLIRVEEGAILYRRGRDSPGARSARSGRIGHGFRKHKLNADDSSALSAYSQISHVSSMGVASLEEDGGDKPSGARPSPLGGRDKDVLLDDKSLNEDDFTDTLEVGKRFTFCHFIMACLFYHVYVFLNDFVIM